MNDSQRIWLDGDWDFQLDPSSSADATPAGEWRSAVVPLPWQAQFADLRNTSGTAWYRRFFTIDQADLRSTGIGSAILHFGAVDYHATVWLNGKLVGEHEGGYLPFELDIFDLLLEGNNELLVKVIDPTDDRLRYADYPFSEVPHGKQSWYGPVGGIWQSVWLELRPRLHIVQTRLFPSPVYSSIGIQVVLSGAIQEGYRVVCSAVDPQGKVVGSDVLDISLAGSLRLDAPPALWSPDSPNLYTVTTSLELNGDCIHSEAKTCGFRTIETRSGRIYLNGEPIYLRGVLDQAYYPETIYTPPSVDFLEAQVRQAKALGLNCLRTHIKVEDPRYYDVADRLGILIWTEIPNWALLTKRSAERGRQTFNGLIERDGHHPSIIAWTLINENWGTDLTRNAEHRQWLAEFYHYAKSVDPTRLIIDNSACGGNAHVASDLEDYHHYRAIPDHAGAWDEWVAEFAGRSDWAWYADFIQERRPDLPLLVSEFGNWGLPNPRSIFEHDKEPWWFETGFEWDNGIVYPHGVLNRFEACGLADVFSSYEEFSRHAQEHMARSLHYEITSMRWQDVIAGYIITEFTDVHWECNGLLTMQRQPKHRLDPLLTDVNQDRVVLLRPRQWSGRPGEAVEVNVQTSGIAGVETCGSVQWQFGNQQGTLPSPGGMVSVELESPGTTTLYASWIAENGTHFASNQVDLACVAVKPASAGLRVLDNPPLAAVLRELGYAVSDEAAGPAAEDEIVVACRYTRALEQLLQKGGRVILLADALIQDRSEERAALPVGYVSPRAGTSWQGDWANSLSWVKKQGLLAHLPGGPLLEMEWAAIMPDAVLAGLPSWILRTHSWAGLTVGWVHKTVSLLAVLPYGKGQILITTFKLNATTLAADAVAQALFAGMLDLF